MYEKFDVWGGGEMFIHENLNQHWQSVIPILYITPGGRGVLST